MTVSLPVMIFSYRLDLRNFSNQTLGFLALFFSLFTRTTVQNLIPALKNPFSLIHPNDSNHHQKTKMHAYEGSFKT